MPSKNITTKQAAKIANQFATDPTSVLHALGNAGNKSPTGHEFFVTPYVIAGGFSIGPKYPITPGDMPNEEIIEAIRADPAIRQEWCDKIHHIRPDVGVELLSVPLLAALLQNGHDQEAAELEAAIRPNSGVRGVRMYPKDSELLPQPFRPRPTVPVLSPEAAAIQLGRRGNKYEREMGVLSGVLAAKEELADIGKLLSAYGGQLGFDPEIVPTTEAANQLEKYKRPQWDHKKVDAWVPVGNLEKELKLLKHERDRLRNTKKMYNCTKWHREYLKSIEANLIPEKTAELATARTTWEGAHTEEIYHTWFPQPKNRHHGCVYTVYLSLQLVSHPETKPPVRSNTDDTPVALTELRKRINNATLGKPNLDVLRARMAELQVRTEQARALASVYAQVNDPDCISDEWINAIAKQVNIDDEQHPLRSTLQLSVPRTLKELTDRGRLKSAEMLADSIGHIKAYAQNYEECDDESCYLRRLRYLIATAWSHRRGLLLIGKEQVGQPPVEDTPHWRVLSRVLPGTSNEGQSTALLRTLLQLYFEHFPGTVLPNRLGKCMYSLLSDVPALRGKIEGTQLPLFTVMEVHGVDIFSEFFSDKYVAAVLKWLSATGLNEVYCKYFSIDIQVSDDTIRSKRLMSSEEFMSRMIEPQKQHYWEHTEGWGTLADGKIIYTQMMLSAFNIPELWRLAMHIGVPVDLLQVSKAAFLHVVQHLEKKEIKGNKLLALAHAMRNLVCYVSHLHHESEERTVLFVKWMAAKIHWRHAHRKGVDTTEALSSSLGSPLSTTWDSFSDYWRACRKNSASTGETEVRTQLRHCLACCDDSLSSKLCIVVLAPLIKSLCRDPSSLPDHRVVVGWCDTSSVKQPEQSELDAWVNSLSME